ncbi:MULTISPECIES: hypothetical protein [unclassified Pseudodesulfovibrio]|uniref:hypothetical protein n=1 Tax=unclassified Pseudodesulfovibrio TaxID=2661612 RepID=UPI000FEB72F5|nr:MULTISPECIES: hypothetical protein [unclassified Pseudodesulfovibrio]MCJ2163124.1 hypothetical protein [Pseudodesulfovibrio sp. S3-i]RWU07116.1 hypothetical protein DWB63_01005 [Pseudodesulfovibrio sp. S3]
MTKHFIKEQYDVDEAGATKAFGKGERREDYADAWRATGNAVLVGLPGSGKADLARLLGKRTGQKVLQPADPEEAVEALKGEGVIIVLDDALVEHPLVTPLIHGAGKVFYLMADTRLLSARVAERGGGEDMDELWRAMSARLADIEPTFYSVLHFIMQGVRSPEELVDDAMVKLGY